MYTAKDFTHLLGTSGFSDALLNNHFKLYQGYVTNSNVLIERIEALAKDGKFAPGEFQELKRRFGWEFNGMRLHELYFENMTKGGVSIDTSSALYTQIASDFGSFEAFLAEFKATGSMRGIGWAVLFYDSQCGKLSISWINEHDVGLLAGAMPIVVMDVFEHAFMLDYGLNRADYLSAFMNALNWHICQERFNKLK